MTQCCICFDRFAIGQLNVVDGKPENVCKECAEYEQEEIARRG